MYHYKCQVFNVVDGDTVDCAIDLGLRINTVQRVRLYGINAPEKSGETREQGISAQSFLRFLVIGKSLTIRTIKDRSDKYGRMLGVFFESGAERSVNQKMLDNEKAVLYMATLDDRGLLTVPE